MLEQNFCPVCGDTPLEVEWEYGTLDFKCVSCGIPLEPTAKTLIELLPIVDRK